MKPISDTYGANKKGALSITENKKSRWLPT
jgi:hypothetical protein